MKTRKQRFNAIVSASNRNLNACVIQLAESYLSDFPNSQGAWDLYSLALYRIDRFKDAKKALHKAIKLIDESTKQEHLSWLFCRMGNIYESSGDFNKAIKWYREAHQAHPLEATFLIYEGVMLLRIEKYDESSKVLAKGTTCSEGCIDEAFYNLGVVKIAQNRYEEARLCFEEALKIDPKYKEAKQQIKDVESVLELLKKE